jgi:ribonuclease P protein component
MGTASLDVRAVVTASRCSRVGFVVPKYGHSAVRRNQLKRALRELSRLRLLTVLSDSDSEPGVDVVMRARPVAYQASHTELRNEFEEVRARLMRVRGVARSGTQTASGDSQCGGTTE